MLLCRCVVETALPGSIILVVVVRGEKPVE